jgi:hypothetical protein
MYNTFFEKSDCEDDDKDDDDDDDDDWFYDSIKR